MLKKSLLVLLAAVSCMAEEMSLSTSKARLDVRDGVQATLSVGGTEVGIPSLWRMEFHGFPAVRSEAFLRDPWNGTATMSKTDENTLRISCRSQKLDVDFIVEVKDDGMDFHAEVLRTEQPVREVVFPDATVFPLGRMERVIFPHSGARNNGIAFLPSYFKRHTRNTPMGYKLSGEKGFISIYGAEPIRLPDNPQSLPLRVTAAGREWFAPEYIKDIENGSLAVYRPPREGQADVNLVESDKGAALTGAHLGGDGWLFRVTSNGGASREQANKTTRAMVHATMESLLRREPQTYRGKLFAIVNPQGSPERGMATPVAVEDWVGDFGNCPYLRKAEVNCTVLRSSEQMREALANPRVAVILNPFGEIFPSGGEDRLMDDLKAVAAFVRRGGIWWETGGYPFFYVSIPQELCRYETAYPGDVADFTQVRYDGHAITMYGVQPMMRHPWDAERYCHPVCHDIAGTGESANIHHRWVVAVEPGQSWKSPVYRWAFNYRTPQEALEEYARVNDIHVKLAEKVKPATLETLKGAMLLLLTTAPVAKQIQALDDIPKGNLIHYTSYLHGGFDKQYPDHLPPNPQWGNMDDLRRFIEAIHDKGHLAMPYTNTSWWCIGPKGPTFEAAGEEPLARDRQGRLKLEQYGERPNEGYSLCFFHPAVQAAHRKVGRQMTELGCDIILQDQVGSRGWTWDYNPLEPFPTAANVGMRSLSMEDMAAGIPVACEDGHDRVLNFETMICGASWGLIPVYGQYQKRHAKYNYPQGDWQFFPTLSYLGHDKCLFTNHDLAHFTGNPEQLASAIAFGYATSEVWDSEQGYNLVKRNWLHWLDAVQKSACKDYAGRKLLDYAYLEENSGRPFPHMLIYSRYDGDICVIANTGDQPLPLAGLMARTAFPEHEKRWLEKQTLPPYGFYVSSPRVRAARLYVLTLPPRAYTMRQQRPQKVYSLALRQENGRLTGTFLAPPQVVVSLPVPGDWKSGMLTFASSDTQKTVEATVRGGMLVLPSPAVSTARLNMPVALQSQSPASLKATKPTVAVFNLKNYDDDGYHAKASYLAGALSEQLQGTDLSVVEITTFEEFLNLLKNPFQPGYPFAVVNPSAETSLGPDGMPYLEMARLIKGYVECGGIWWETGGCPFHYYRKVKSDGSFTKEFLGLGGLAPFALTCSLNGYNDPVEPLTVTDTGRKWFSPQLVKRIELTFSNTRRSLRGAAPSIPLVSGVSDEFIALHRLDGWGFFGNLAGFRFPDSLAPEVIAGTLAHLWTSPWPEPMRESQEIAWMVK